MEVWRGGCVSYLAALCVNVVAAHSTLHCSKIGVQALGRAHAVDEFIYIGHIKELDALAVQDGQPAGSG